MPYTTGRFGRNAAQTNRALTARVRGTTGLSKVSLNTQNQQQGSPNIALLCAMHAVARILIISEDLGGHTATGPSSLWSIKELQTLGRPGSRTPWRCSRARASSGTQNIGMRQESCRTFHQFPGLLHSCSKFTTGHQI